MPGAHHHLSASAETIHWGFFDAQLKPVLTVRSGDTITIDTISGGPEILENCSFLILPEHPAVLKALTPKLGLHILTLSASMNKRRAAAMSPMSQRQEKERRPRARMAASTSDAPSSSSLWQKATSAPSAAKARAIAAPIPRLPPVMRAVRFSSLPVTATG
jgi:hypothetical protein